MQLVTLLQFKPDVVVLNGCDFVKVDMVDPKVFHILCVQVIQNPPFQNTGSARG